MDFHWRLGINAIPHVGFWLEFGSQDGTADGTAELIRRFGTIPGNVETTVAAYLLVDIWVYLKIGYTSNYSHLVGIVIINHWV